MAKAAGAESTSCGGGSGGRGCAREPELATWPGTMWSRESEAEGSFLRVMVVEESGWLSWVAQEGRAEEEEVQERRRRKREEVR